MRPFKLPMHRSSGYVLQLADLLAALPDNDWSWSLLDFYGIGIAPDEMPMADFEEIVRSNPAGYLFSWQALKAFSLGLEQTYDCLLVAVTSENDLVPAELAVDNFERCEVVVQAFDSTEWSLGATDQKLLDNFSKRINKS